jgi:putative heme-binding domain-containing protein
LEMQRGQPSTRRRIETQILHFDGQGWNAYTYRWNAAQTDAELVPAQGTNDTFTVVDPTAPGGRREVPWRFVGRAECLRCHNAWAGETLSFNWLQLNTPGESSELRRLEDLGVLRVQKPPRPLPRLANPYDSSLPLAARARAWLHVNCSTCHRNGAGGDVPSWFNHDQSLETTRAYDAKPARGGFGLLGARVIAPGDPDRSTLVYRISTEGSARMPHIGSRLADEAGVRLIRDWIRSMPAGPGNDAEVMAARKLAEENAALLLLCAGAGRGDAVTRLLSSMSGALALLDKSISVGADVRRLTNSASLRNVDQSLLTSAPTAEMTRFRAEVASAAATHTNALVCDLFQQLLPPNQRRATLGGEFNPQTVLSLQGHAGRGRELFSGMAQCARCHVCDGVGRAFGPDLGGISRKYTREQLLDQVLHPSKVIAPEFKTTLVTLRDDTELSGFVLKRSGTELLLRDETLAERLIKLADIRETRESALSAMPEGLLAPLTAPEAADLLEYLSASKLPATSTK